MQTLGADMFTMQDDRITIPSMPAFLAFSRFNPRHRDEFLNDMTLLEDLVTEGGMSLFAKGTTFTYEQVARLVRFQANNPRVTFRFTIERKQGIINAFCRQIEGDFMALLTSKSGRGLYRKILSHLIRHVERAMQSLVTQDRLVIKLYRLKIAAEHHQESLARRLYYHAMNTAITAASVFHTRQHRADLAVDPADMTRIILAALLHNLGAIMQSDDLLKQPQKQQYLKYIELRTQTPSYLADVDLFPDLELSLIMYFGYHQQNRSFLRQDTTAATCANILLVSDVFCQQISGLFSEQLPVDKVLDELNQRALEEQYNVPAVQALTSALDRIEIFDFYVEMDALMQMCPFGVARPYPMKGIRSPVVFICRDFRTDCEHLESSVKAVNLMDAQGDLPPNSYSRCRLTTRRLLAFYKEHYRDIKALAWNKADSAKADDNGNGKSEQHRKVVAECRNGSR